MILWWCPTISTAFWKSQGRPLWSPKINSNICQISDLLALFWSPIFTRISCFWQKLDLRCQPGYKPEISPELIKLAKQITDKFKDAKHCIWETEWLNEFSQHQTSRRVILIEIEKDFVESLYYELKDSSRKEIYLNPNEKTINFYIAESNYPVIIKQLITRSPISKRTDKGGKFYTPLLEKILVNLFAEEKLFNYLQGSELMREQWQTSFTSGGGGIAKCLNHSSTHCDGHSPYPCPVLCHKYHYMHSQQHASLCRWWASAKS